MIKFADVTLEGSNQTIVLVVAAIAIAALVVAAVLVRQVLSADQGTDRMQDIAGPAFLTTVLHGDRTGGGD